MTEYWWRIAEKHPAWRAFVQHLNGNVSFAMKSHTGWEWFAVGYEKGVEEGRRLFSVVPEAAFDDPRRTAEGVWIEADGTSCARHIAILAMLACGLDDSDFKLRDKVIKAIAPHLEHLLDAVERGSNTP